jgi:hypothetical protein
MRCFKKSDQFFPAGNKNSVDPKSEFKHYHDLPKKTPQGVPCPSEKPE